jgi:RimJ/RimL family protein N-acetyltransferase
MFARTKNLLLRPGWSEDADALAQAIAHESVISDLCWGRWPADTGQIDRWLRHVRDPILPNLLVFSRVDGPPELVGGVGLHRMADGAAELDFWISPQARGRGFATEAARAMLGMAKALSLSQLAACVFSENGAAARVLEKLGFGPNGSITRRPASRPLPAQALRFTRAMDDRRMKASLMAA